MNIQQIADLFHLNKQTVRFYRDQQLLAPRQNAENHYFCYGIDELAGLFQILKLRQSDHTLQNIREYMTDGDEALRAYLSKEEQHLMRMEEKLAELTRRHDELQRHIEYRRSVIGIQTEVHLEEGSSGLYFLTMDQFKANPQDISTLVSTISSYQSLVIPLEQFLDPDRQVYLPHYALGITHRNYRSHQELQACNLSRYHTIEEGHTALRFVLHLQNLDQLEAALFQPVKDFAAVHALRFIAPVTSIILITTCQPSNSYYVLFRFLVSPLDQPVSPSVYTPPTSF